MPTPYCEVLKLMPDGDFFMVEHVAQLLNGESSNPLKTIQMRISKQTWAKRCEGSGIKRVAMIAAAGCTMFC